jgi:hypothetical protein
MVSLLRLKGRLQKDGWVFGRKRRGDRSGMKLENLRGVSQLTGDRAKKLEIFSAAPFLLPLFMP